MTGAMINWNELPAIPPNPQGKFLFKPNKNKSWIDVKREGIIRYIL